MKMKYIHYSPKCVRVNGLHWLYIGKESPYWLALTIGWDWLLEKYVFELRLFGIGLDFQWSAKDGFSKNEWIWR